VEWARGFGHHALGASRVDTADSGDSRLASHSAEKREVAVFGEVGHRSDGPFAVAEESHSLEVPTVVLTAHEGLESQQETAMPL
jgi:hypothetical protein